MRPSPRLLNVLRWLGLTEAALAVCLGLFGEDLFYLAPRVRPVLVALLCAGVAFAAYSWWSPRKILVPVAAIGMLAVGAANLTLSIFWSPRYAAILEPDPDTIYRLIPGTVKLSRNPDGEWIRWSVNSRGYRGPEFAEDPAAIRVVVYGDSFVEARFSRLPDTFSAQLGDKISARLGQPVEVINAGVGGYGPDQSLRRMRRDLPTVRPRLCILVLFAGNDFGDLIRNRLYRIGPTAELEQNRFTLSPRLMREFDGSRRRPVLLNVVEMAWRNWRSSRLIPDNARHIQKARQLEYEDYVVNGNNEIDNIGTDTSDLDIALDPSSPAASYKIRMMELVLADSLRAAEEHDSAFAVLIVGRAEDLAGDPALESVKLSSYRPSNLTDILESIAGRQNIPYVNAYGTFQRAGADAVYFLANNDHHWNNSGQRMAAELVAEFVTSGESLLLPSRAESR